VLSGQVEEWMWRKIIEKMYDPRDFEILERRFTQLLEDKRRARLPPPAAMSADKAAARKLNREELM
jgi:hypothetical protein